MVDQDPLIPQIFKLQNIVLSQNMQEFSVLYGFISDCIDLIGEPGLSKEGWENLPELQRNILNYFYADSFSTLVNSFRLALYGIETDAYALMRVVLENLTIFEYIIQDEQYEAAFIEMQERVQRRRPFSPRFSYKTSLKKLNVNDERNRLWGELSVSGSHASPGRLRMSRLDYGGLVYFKVGAAVENPRTKDTLKVLARLTYYFAQILDTFFLKNSVPEAASFHERLEKFESRIDHDK